MLKLLSRMILLAAALCFTAAPARAHEVWFAHPLQPYELGDPSYWPGTHNWEPGIASGCWKWNWQQRSWYDRCPAYLHPKAFMYRYGTPRVVVRRY